VALWLLIDRAGRLLIKGAIGGGMQQEQSQGKQGRCTLPVAR